MKSINNFIRKNWVFILITLIFLVIKFGMPIIYQGSFVDEYNHIFAGIEFWENGKFPVFKMAQGEYTRGASTSVLVGLFFKLFGQSLYVAKMMPAFIGIIDYFLLYGISKFIFPEKSDKKWRNLLMIIYTTSMYVIFNHFYVRMYILYEFFTLAIIFLGLHLIKAFQEKEWRHITLLIIGIITLNITNYLWSNDDIKYFILFISGVIFLYFYIFDLKSIKASFNGKDKSVLLKIFNNFITFLENNIWIKFLLLLIPAGIILAIPEIQRELDFYLHGNVAYSAQPRHRYAHIFFVYHAVFSLLFIGAIGWDLRKIKYWFKDNSNKDSDSQLLLNKKALFMVEFIAICLWIVFFTMSKHLQITRGIFYFFPIFYIVVVRGFMLLYRLFKFFNIRLRYFYLMGSIMVIFNLMATFFPNAFLHGPNIEAEIVYMRYQKVFEEAKVECEDEVVVFDFHDPWIGEFYGLKPNYVVKPENYRKFGRSYVIVPEGWGDKGVCYLDTGGFR